MAFLHELLVSPYRPDRTYSLGDNTGQFSDADIGKPVKINTGGYLELCADTNEIFGIVTSVEPYTKDGHSIGSVACDSGAQAYAEDTAGTLTRGADVVASTPIALGTAVTYGAPVEARSAAAAADRDCWFVVEVYGSGAGRKCLIQKR